MNIQWTNMTGFGPVAWNHGGRPLEIPTMVHHYENDSGLILHPHEMSKLHQNRIHIHNPHRD